jgi:septum formation protein
MTDLILASGSPRRRLLLSAAGFDFSVKAPDVDEAPRPDEEPAAMVLRLAGAKAAAIERPDAVVLAADTIVVRDGAIIGKPDDSNDALAILGSLQGRAHTVLTGWTVLSGDDEQFGVAESRVVFNERTSDELAGYIDRTEPFDKAGAYALQGDDGWLVREVIGSRSNVMGLPLAEIVVALSSAGVERSHQVASAD